MTDKQPEEIKDFALDKIIEIDQIKDNSVLVFRIKEMNPAILRTLENLIKNYGKALEDKNCSLLVLSADSDLKILEESEMEKAGWQRKNKSNLILPS